MKTLPTTAINFKTSIRKKTKILSRLCYFTIDLTRIGFYFYDYQHLLCLTYPQKRSISFSLTDFISEIIVSTSVENLFKKLYETFQVAVINNSEIYPITLTLSKNKTLESLLT